MAVKSSGTLSFTTDIVGEFGGTTPHSLSEYYRGGSLVGTNNTNVPTSGAIDFSDFYGATAVVSASDVITPTTINGNPTANQITISNYISAGEIFSIPSSWWIWSNSTSTPALIIDISCTIENYGKIIGKGGNGASGFGANGGAGGPAIRINSGVSNVTITNFSGAYIAGGGGGGGSNDLGPAGGGGGAGGGVGGAASVAGGAGGSIGNAGSNGSVAYGSTAPGSGGGAGGSGGTGSSDYNFRSSGGGGGRILPGVGGTNNADGGSAGNAGQNGNSVQAGGGGGWGASGGSGGSGSGSGGAGGKAIEDSGNSYTLTNNGTIYGATT